VSEISLQRLVQLRALLASGREAQFYWWPEWQRLRGDVLQLDRFECQLCKARGRYRKATLVHHVKHLRDRPDLALSLFDPDTGERQLVSVCKKCHEAEHPEALEAHRFEPRSVPLTRERWD